MLRRSLVLAICSALLCGAAFQAAALAQRLERGEGVVMANAYRPIPAGARIVLQLANDTDISLRLHDVAQRALTRAGYKIVSDNPEFTLRLEADRSVVSNRPDRSIGSFSAGSGVGRPKGNPSGPQGEGVDLNFKLWSSSRNSILSPKSAGVAPTEGFGIHITAFDDMAGKPAWEGIARTHDSGGDSFRVGSVMVRYLVDSFGDSLEAETVSLR